jgi:SAM-dependent methyltransferase
MRTDDREYGAHYWDTLDGGLGYSDSVMWQDISHAVWEVLVPDRATGEDRSSQHRCLDVGCAFGYFVRHMQRRGVETFGVDYSRFALEHAPDDVRSQLQWHDLTSENDTFYGEGFTIVTCFETLEHIPEPSIGNALQCIHRALAVNGCAVLTICTDQQPGWDSDPTHVTVKPREWWVRRLAQAGFMIVPDAIEELRRFHLFRHHDGVFVCFQG